MTRQFHRPARLDPEVAEQLEGATDTAIASEYAHLTAQALIDGAPHPDEGSAAVFNSPALAGDDPTAALTREAIAAVVASHGVDAVAELWADSPATTLPGTLWRLYLVQQWIERDPALIERRYATRIDLTEADAPALARLDAALAGAHRAPSVEEIATALAAPLQGDCPGGAPALAPILRATAGFLEALAAGSNPVWIEDDADELADRVTRRDSALLATAEELRESARRAASGRLD